MVQASGRDAPQDASLGRWSRQVQLGIGWMDGCWPVIGGWFHSRIKLNKLNSTPTWGKNTIV